MSDKSSIAAAPPLRYITVADAILEQLRLWGVQRIYGVVGDAIFGLMDAIAKQEAISFIAVKHESVAALMASAEAKLTGRLGVCAAHMGPGLANLMNGLGDAFLDKAPVLAITGQAPLNKIGTSCKQFINQQQMVQAVSSYSELIVHPDTIYESLVQALQTSVSSKTVSHLSIPMDVFALTTTLKPIMMQPAAVSTVGPSMIRNSLQLMKSARRPILLVGGKARAHSAAIQTVAEQWGCGIVLSYGASGTVPDSHPYMLHGLGEGGNPNVAGLFMQADVVLALETTWWPEGLVPHQAQVVHIASDPVSLGVSMRMAAGLTGDITEILFNLMEELEPFVPDPDWIRQIKECKQTWYVQNDTERNQATSPLHPASIIKAVEQHIAEDAVIALDEGDSTLWFLRNFRAISQRVLLSERWRTMGAGLPAAIAAKLSSPEKQVICISGDGGIGMVMADLLTAVKYRLPIVVIVFNNGTLQMERDKMLMKGLQPEGTELTNPDFAKVAEACGWNACQIETVAQLETALQQSLSGSKPVLLDVRTANIPHPDFKS
ncbi:thiamine pyrophosphate-binding protein [Paenibacillus sp. NPDC056579]|uniref:thiamine pyrophosphate-binding protein n=1 Tax=Paenibacillus sp. NPDC056579 TaxID=3345871 RepID=UPI0036AF884B